MNLERYPVKANRGNKKFEFTSLGPMGPIQKVVLFQTIRPRQYNLAFGDKQKNRNINYAAKSNNGDRDKVLATVASIVQDFLRLHPNATILIIGQSVAKVRLYQMGINKHYREISLYCKIRGYRTGGWERFQSGINYAAFIVEAHQKNVNLKWL